MAEHRAKLITTVDAGLLEEVDAYVASHRHLTRGAVIDEALRLWFERRREREIEVQYDDKLVESDEAERAAWRRLRRAAATRLFRPE